MDEIQIVASLIESIGIIGLMLLWLRDKNDQLRHERDSRQFLSIEIIKDWQKMTDSRQKDKLPKD